MQPIVPLLHCVLPLWMEPRVFTIRPPANHEPPQLFCTLILPCTRIFLIIFAMTAILSSCFTSSSSDVEREAAGQSSCELVLLREAKNTEATKAQAHDKSSVLLVLCLSSSDEGTSQHPPNGEGANLKRDLSPHGTPDLFVHASTAFVSTTPTSPQRRQPICGALRRSVRHLKKSPLCPLSPRPHPPLSTLCLGIITPGTSLPLLLTC